MGGIWSQVCAAAQSTGIVTMPIAFGRNPFVIVTPTIVIVAPTIVIGTMLTVIASLTIVIVIPSIVIGTMTIVKMTVLMTKTVMLRRFVANEIPMRFYYRLQKTMEMRFLLTLHQPEKRKIWRMKNKP